MIDRNENEYLPVTVIEGAEEGKRLDVVVDGEIKPIADFLPVLPDSYFEDDEERQQKKMSVLNKLIRFLNDVSGEENEDEIN